MYSNRNKLWEEHKDIRNATTSSATEFQVYPKPITIFVVTYAIISWVLWGLTMASGEDVGQCKMG